MVYAGDQWGFKIALVSNLGSFCRRSRIGVHSMMWNQRFWIGIGTSEEALFENKRSIANAVSAACWRCPEVPSPWAGHPSCKNPFTAIPLRPIEQIRDLCKLRATGPWPDNMQKDPQSFAILGGGVLGMTLAHRLAGAGYPVTIFESGSELGGLASAWNLNGISWDRHYHVTLLSDSHLREMLRTLKLDDQMKWVTTRTGFYMGGKLYSMSNSVEFLKFPPLSLIGKFRLGATIAYASRVKDWKRLESIPVADWLTKLSGKSVFEKMWRPLLRAKLGENYQHASAAFIWAIIARMYAARRSGLKQEMFGYLPGGYGRFFDRFGELLKSESVEIKLNSAARRVDAQANGTVQVELAGGDRRTFDQVIMTLPSAVAANLCPALSQAERDKLNGIRYQGIICASVLLKNPLATYYVTNLIDSWVPFTAVIEMTTLVDRDQLGGNCLVYLPKYVDPTDPMFEQTDEQIRESFVSALENMYPDFKRSDVIAFQVSRVRRVLAISTLNYSQNLPAMKTTVPGVHIINSAHISNGTLNVNETIQLANTAADALLTERKGTGTFSAAEKGPRP
jgi:protoporphyrinogen oxidase